MARIIGIGYQDFTELIASGCFYVDKTEFIREWWENQDVVTLIARPRRFEKTLNMSMLERFFSIECGMYWKNMVSHLKEKRFLLADIWKLKKNSANGFVP